MPATSKKLTVREVQDRVKEILARHSVACGKSSWIDPEGVQGLIDDLREDVIQAIAGGSKVPYALTRCIAELPRVHYGTIPTEPVRTTVTKIAASSMYGKLPTESRQDEVLLVERYQRCVIELLSMFPSDPLGNCPAHFYIERLEELIKQKLLRPNLPDSKSNYDNRLSNIMTSEQSYAVGEFLGRGYDNKLPASAYPSNRLEILRIELAGILIQRRKTFRNAVEIIQRYTEEVEGDSSSVGSLTLDSALDFYRECQKRLDEVRSAIATLSSDRLSSSVDTTGSTSRSF